MLWTAFVVGIAGSLHCAGMCSPLAMAVTRLSNPALKNRLLYNLGRVVTYGMLGAVVSAVGFFLPLAEFQLPLSLVLGVVLIVGAVSGISVFRMSFLEKAFSKISLRLKNVFSNVLKRRTPFTILFLGAINGLLPCGLTFLALTFCITLTTPLQGFVFMVVFGMGTLPAMLGLPALMGFISMKSNWNTRYISAGLMALSGVLLIVRVLMIHVPEAQDIHPEIVICH